MSLYDSFFSGLNKDHVYHLIKDIIFENHNVNIFLDNEFRQIYDKNLQRIFDGNNVANLEEINNICVNETIVLFNDKIKLQLSDDTTYDTDVKSDYDSLFTERMKQNDMFKNMKTEKEEKELKDKLEKEQLEQNRLEQNRLEQNRLEQERLNKERLELEQMKLDAISYQSNIRQLPSIVEEPIDEVEEFRQVQRIVSNKRSHIKSSRYNYSFNLKNNNIVINPDSTIHKLIIPLEDNYIFDHSILSLSIKELDLDISLELEKELVNNHRTYGVYVPIEAHRFSNINNVDSVTINITDITNTDYVSYDIINVTKLEIKDDSIILNVNSVKDILLHDYFKVLNLSTNIMELRYLLLEPMKVVKVEKNRLHFKTNYIMNNTIVEDIEMKLMNVSNQNVLFF